MNEELSIDRRCREWWFYSGGEFAVVMPGPGPGYFFVAATENRGGIFVGNRRAIHRRHVKRQLSLLGIKNPHLLSSSPAGFSHENFWVVDRTSGVRGLNLLGAIYFIQGVDGGPIKIGWSSDAIARLRAIQPYSPVKLAIRGIIAGTGRAHERRMHAKFRHLRLHGEWFAPEIDLLRFIEISTEAVQ